MTGHPDPRRRDRDHTGTRRRDHATTKSNSGKSGQHEQCESTTFHDASP